MFTLNYLLVNRSYSVEVFMEESLDREMDSASITSNEKFLK